MIRTDKLEPGCVVLERARRRLSGGRIPVWVKLLYTAWVVVLVPVYWQPTPVNLLWFCNIALRL